MTRKSNTFKKKALDSLVGGGSSHSSRCEILWQSRFQKIWISCIGLSQTKACSAPSQQFLVSLKAIISRRRWKLKNYPNKADWFGNSWWVRVWYICTQPLSERNSSAWSGMMRSMSVSFAYICSYWQIGWKLAKSQLEAMVYLHSLNIEEPCTLWAPEDTIEHSIRRPTRTSTRIYPKNCSMMISLHSSR